MLYFIRCGQWVKVGVSARRSPRIPLWRSNHIMIRLPDVALNDPRLAPSFLSVVASAAPQEEQP